MRRVLKDPAALGRSLSGLASILSDQDQHDAARELYLEAHKIFHDVGDLTWAAGTLGQLADIELQLGNFTAARDRAEQALRLYRDISNPAWKSLTLDYLTRALIELGESHAARAVQSESLGIKQRIRDKLGIAASLEICGGLAVKIDEAEEAARFLAAAQHLRQDIGAPLRPGEAIFHQRDLKKVQAALPKAKFTRAWEDGLALSWDQAAQAALDWPNNAPQKRSTEK